MSKVYDVIILGAGPAGLAAGLYAGRSRLSTLIIEKGQDGGQIAITDEIENYPGQMVEGESGPSLIARMTEQAKKFGAERCSDVIKSVDLTGEVKKLVGNKGEYEAKCVIVATGAFPKPIGCENEGKFTGKGISFCATCDASFFEDFEVYVVGGGDVPDQVRPEGHHHPPAQRAESGQVHPGEGLRQPEDRLSVGQRGGQGGRR